MKTHFLAAVVLLVGVSCVPPDEPMGPDEAAARARGAIIGGTTDFGDPEVFMLISVYEDGQQGSCSATLIGERTLLTAAHCVDPRMNNASSMQLWAHNKTSVNQASNADLIQIVETRIEPRWNPFVSLANDVALARLAYSPNVPPKAWNTQSVSGYIGKPLRAVGYGTTATQESGVKHTVNLTFRDVNATHIALGDQVGKGVCHGDSGGPSFHTFSDGVERVVGVHSFTASEDCVDGADIRVDPYASFIQTWMNEKEGPRCDRDGRCAANCPSVDLDCVCADDGACTTECPDLTADPDCPKDCVANQICSIDPCPEPDPDCVPQGAECTFAEQCQYRQCISDVQHPKPYCSRPCTQNSECSSGLECSSAQLCQFPAPKPPTVLPLAHGGGPARSSSCSAAGGSPWALGLFAAAALLRRRKR